MAYCHQCGVAVTATAFCPKCGAARRQPPDAAIRPAELPATVTQTPATRQVEHDLVTSPGVPVAPADTLAAPKPSRPHRHLRVLAAGAVGVLVLVVLAGVLLNRHVGGKANQSHNAVAGASPSSPSTPSSPSSNDISTTPTAAAPAPAAPTHSGYPASLLAMDETGALPIYGGPSSSAFDHTGTGRALQKVTVTCTGYGDPFTALGASSRLWDYINVGWLSDQVVQTGLSVPAVPACEGNVTSPTPSTQMPSKTLGPFPVVADGPLSVHTQPDMGSPALREIHSGDLVLRSCSTPTATRVAPPSHLASAGGNAYWDRLQSGGGWIPDSYVDTGTGGAAAPRC